MASSNDSELLNLAHFVYTIHSVIPLEKKQAFGDQGLALGPILGLSRPWPSLGQIVGGTLDWPVPIARHRYAFNFSYFRPEATD